MDPVITPLVVRLLEIAVPQVIGAVIRHYEKKADLTDEQKTKLDAHKAALAVLCPAPVPEKKP